MSPGNPQPAGAGVAGIARLGDGYGTMKCNPAQKQRDDLSPRNYTRRLHVKTISTLNAPTARGHYSQAVVHGGVVYVAGQLPIVPGEPEKQLASFEEQARRVIDNVLAILDEAGSGAELILKATVYITDVSHWPAFNEIYAEKLGAHKPARTVVPVAALHYGYLVEMDAIAALRQS
jgi:2-iminobutanoate/2-iminopropanoate deaminase